MKDTVIAYCRKSLDEVAVFVPYMSYSDRIEFTDEMENKKNAERDYLAESKNRAVRKFTEYMHCNEWDCFITLTVSPNAVKDRSSVEEVGALLTAVFNRYRKEYDPDFKFLVVPELHKDGSIHFHGFAKFGNYDMFNIKPNSKLKYSINLFFLKYFGLNNCRWFHGYKYARRSACRYALKYALKADLSIMKSVYRCSRGLNVYERFKLYMEDRELTRRLAFGDFKCKQCDFGVMYFLEIEEFELLKRGFVPMGNDCICPFEADLQLSI